MLGDKLSRRDFLNDFLKRSAVVLGVGAVAAAGLKFDQVIQGSSQSEETPTNPLAPEDIPESEDTPTPESLQSQFEESGLSGELAVTHMRIASASDSGGIPNSVVGIDFWAEGREYEVFVPMEAVRRALGKGTSDQPTISFEPTEGAVAPEVNDVENWLPVTGNTKVKQITVPQVFADQINKIPATPTESDQPTIVSETPEPTETPAPTSTPTEQVVPTQTQPSSGPPIATGASNQERGAPIPIGTAADSVPSPDDAEQPSIVPYTPPTSTPGSDGGYNFMPTIPGTTSDNGDSSDDSIPAPTEQQVIVPADGFNPQAPVDEPTISPGS